MDQLYLSVAAIAAVALLLALSSDGLKGRIWLLSTPLAATLAGIIVGPQLLELLRPYEWTRPHELLLEVARLSVAMAVMSVALRVPRGFWVRHADAMVLVLTVGLAAMWAASAMLAWLVLPISFASALLVGAVLTPTDPVIAGSITTGSVARRLAPARIRYGLAAEAGASGGAAYAFVTLPLMAMLGNGASSWGTYLTDALLRGIVLACVAGVIIGMIVGLLQRVAERFSLPGSATLPSVTMALALLTLSVLKLLGSDGILGVFVAGVAFNAVVSNDREREREQEQLQERVQEVANHLVSWPAFVLFGAMLPWGAWTGRVGSLVLLAVAVLLIRRPPWFYLLLRPVAIGRGRADRVFLSWFGPIGMAAIFYALHAHTHGQPETWTFASFVILASIVVHGMTATPGTRWYGARTRERRLKSLQRVNKMIRPSRLPTASMKSMMALSNGNDHGEHRGDRDP